MSQPCRQIGILVYSEEMARKKPSLKGGAAVRAKKAPGTRAKGPTKADARAEEGKTTPATGTIERANEYAAIYDKWRGGFDTTTLAKEHDKSPRRIQQIVDEMRASAEEATHFYHPLHALRSMGELLVQLERAITQAAQIREAAMDSGNLSVALGALRTVAEARRELTQIKTSIGLMPRNPRWIHHQLDGYDFINAVNAVLDRNGVSQEVREEILAEVGLHSRGVDDGVKIDYTAQAYNRSMQVYARPAREETLGHDHERKKQ